MAKSPLLVSTYSRFRERPRFSDQYGFPKSTDRRAGRRVASLPQVPGGFQRDLARSGNLRIEGVAAKKQVGQWYVTRVRQLGVGAEIARDQGEAPGPLFKRQAEMQAQRGCDLKKRVQVVMHML